MLNLSNKVLPGVLDVQAVADAADVPAHVTPGVFGVTPGTVSVVGVTPEQAAQDNARVLASVLVPAGLVGLVAWHVLHPVAGVILGGGVVGVNLTWDLSGDVHRAFGLTDHPDLGDVTRYEVSAVVPPIVPPPR